MRISFVKYMLKNTHEWTCRDICLTLSSTIHTGGSRYPGYMDSCLHRNDKGELAATPYSNLCNTIHTDKSLYPGYIWIPFFNGMEINEPY
jgi:hypothetical protein